MVKVNQKKLKAENFRYVTKQVIKNPMIYLDDFFGHQTSIDYWMRDIHLLVNAAAYSDMASPAMTENGFYCRQLIEQVEVAYIIYKQCGLKKQKEPLAFFKTRDDYFAYSFHGEYTYDGETNPADTLSKFFSFQSLRQWYSILDDVMEYLAYSKASHYDRFGDKIVVIRELLLRMAQALSDIYENDGLFVRVPSYFIARPSVAFEGKMPRSKLGEYIDKVIDERREKATAELESLDEEADDEPALSVDEPESVDNGDDDEQGEAVATNGEGK
ncbi:hypothetical protein [Parapedobacter sp. DT-150]|uniref:hypothetical protein n=1 Tax=Parapedobacter sp. DT-150 TaxID=3396162 RepID=UPI003F1C7615